MYPQSVFRQVQSRWSQGGAGQPVKRHGNAYKNFNCLVPRCNNRVVSRRRARDHAESSVALDRSAGDPVLAGNMASDSDHLVAHHHSPG